MTNPSPDISRSLSLVGWLLASWAVMVVIGFISLRMPGALRARNPVSFDRAVFTSANVATQTGFLQQFAQPTDFDPAVQWVFALQTVSGALLSLIGGGVLLARVLRLPYTDGQIAATALLMLVGGALLGALVKQPNDSLTRAGFRGLAAVSCSGFAFGNAIDVKSAAFTALLGPLSVVGSLGVIVVLDVYAAVRYRQPLNEHVRRVLNFGAMTFLIGVLIGAAMIRIDGGHAKDALLRSNAIALAARGYGVPFEFITDRPRGLMWETIVLIALGAGTAGAGGALGFGWLVTLPAGFGVAIRRILLWQIGVFGLAFLVLLQTEPQLPADSLIVLVVSASMNVGLSHEMISMTGLGPVILALLTLLGKLFPLIFFRSILPSGTQLL